MKTIAVIGAGQLGSRHLQGLMRLPTACDIHVVDPSAAALDVAATRATEISGAERHALTFTQRIEDLPVTIDYVVVATSSDVRLDVMRRLLAHARVGGLLLEKVLFQALDDYDAAAALLQDNGVPAWVNCTRRMFDIYGQVCTYLAGRTLWSFDVSGGEWGLGCNGIHFLDAFAFLSGEPVTTFDTDGLDDTIHASRRPGFVEFTGALSGRSQSGVFRAVAYRGLSVPLIVTVRAGDRSCILNEGEGWAVFADHALGTSETRRFTLPLLSDLSSSIAAAILDGEAISLPTYAESAACHRPFIAALTDFIGQRTGVLPALCPIT